jgi:HlyD family type I secretion membrane fusion protein
MNLALPSPISGSPQIKGSYKTWTRAGYAIILLGMVTTGTFAAYANISSAVFAPGVVVVESSRKTVQHLEGGLVREILVKDAQEVQSGEVLIRLDPIRAKAKADLYRNQLFALLAAQGRLEAEQVEAEQMSFPQFLAASVNNPEAARIMAEEEKVFIQGRESLANQIAILNNRIAQLEQQVVGYQSQVNSLETQIASLTLQNESLTTLSVDGLVAGNTLRQSERALAALEGQHGAAIAQLATARGNIEESRLQIDQLRQDYRRSAADKLASIRPQVIDLREQLGVAEDALARVDIRAPQTGIVQNLAVHTVGGVIGPGAPIMEIVPTGDDLVINAQISPTAIDSVHPEMVAEIRFTAFHTRNMPIMNGTITSVSADAITDERTGVSYFRARIAVDDADIPAEVRDKLQPGMPADVVVATGERTVMDYFTRPLTESLGRGMREE